MKSLGDKHPAYSVDAATGERVLWAHEFDGRMSRLLACAKLFVQDKVATGCAVPPKHIFALHLYTMQSSIFADANRAMRGVDAAMTAHWQPFIFHLDRALATLNARSTVVFRGLHLRDAGDGTVKKFLDGNTHARRGVAGRAQDEIDVTYHVGRSVLWPAFSSTSTDPAIALAYATKNLDPHLKEAAVVLKIHTRKVYPIREFSYYPFEEELLYKGNTCFRVKALLEPTAYNLRAGTAGSSSAFSCDTAHIVSSSLELDDAQRRERLLIEMHEEPLPENHHMMPCF